MNRLFMWLMRALLVLGTCLAAVRPNEAMGQSSSLFRRASANTPGLAVRPANSGYEGQGYLSSVSYLAVKPLPKRIYQVGDLVTVIVRQKSEYKHSGKTDLERKVEYQAELKDWIRLHDCKLIPDTMPAGDPKLNFALDRSFEGTGKKDRSDEIITRTTCRVVDVLPNKCLVLEGDDVIVTDGEKQPIKLTGTCRSEDIGADNTILSTQLYQCRITQDNSGAVRDSMRRGWTYRLWDLVRPF